MAQGFPRRQCPDIADDERPDGAPEAAKGGSKGDQATAAGAAPQGKSPCGGSGSAVGGKKDAGILRRGRGGLTAATDRHTALDILDGAVCVGARARVAALLGVGLTTLQRWRRQFAGGGDGIDHRKGSHRNVSHRLSEEERQQILLTCNELEFAALPLGQIVPVLANRGLFIGSVHSFYRVLHGNGQAHRRGRARLPKEPRPVPRLHAGGSNQVWNWDISYLPTSVKGIWLYLYLVMDVWSRKVLAWDVESSEDPKLAASLIGRACLRERITRQRKQPLILHADNCNAIRAAPGSATRRARRVEILLQAKGLKRQTLLRVVVAHH